MDRARLVAVDVVAQAVEVAGPEPLGEGEEVPAEHALTEQRHVEQVGARRHEHLGDPATSVVERARPSTSWRYAVSGPIVSTPRRSVGIR